MAMAMTAAVLLLLIVVLVAVQLTGRLGRSNPRLSSASETTSPFSSLFPTATVPVLPAAPSSSLSADRGVITVPSGATSTEAFLMHRANSFYTLAANTSATQMMTLLAPYTSACSGPSHLSDSALGGVDPTSAESVQRLGAAQVLQLALFQNQTQYLSAAIAMVQLDVAIRIRQFRLWAVSSAAIADNGPDGDVNQRSERGDIAWEAWLLAQAGAYWTAEPGMAAVGSTQQLVEQFTTDYVEALCNQTTWPTTGYNKEVAQGLHPAAVMGIYGQTAFQRLWPNTTRGFFSFWNGMLLGQKGSYEPDNSPGYANFNIGMVFSMALWMGRVSRTAANASDPNAYLSDSVDIPRVLNNVMAEMMPNGAAVNYNRGLPKWIPLTAGGPFYAWNQFATNAPFDLYMGYVLYGSTKYLYAARKIERYMIAMGLLPSTRLLASEVYPTNIKQFNVVGVQPPPIVSELTYMRVSPYCYQGQLLCRGTPQANTILIPNKMVLRAGSVPGSDNSAYVLLSLSGAGQHANMDQRMTLENTLYNGSYITARPGSSAGGLFDVDQVNLCNCILIMPSNFTNQSLSYPLVNDISTSFYNNVRLSPAFNNYILHSAAVEQLADGNAYGSMLYAQYQYPGVRAGRQVVLTAAGIIVVVDTVYNSGLTNIAFHAGVTYRLWPHVTASGSNWALQAPFLATNSTGPLPPTTNTSTLFWISPASGRSFGLKSEKLSDFGLGSYAGQTASTLYAYDSVSGTGKASTTHTFVSVLYPLLKPSEAATIASQITTRVNTTDGSMSVSIPGHAVISVPAMSILPPVGSLLVWLSAKSLSTGTYNRSLSSWADISGNNYTFTTMSHTLPAVVSPTAMNGHPAVLFNGSQAMEGPAIFPLNSDYSITALIQSPVSSANRQSIVGSTYSSPGQHGLAVVIGKFGGHLARVHNTVTVASTTIAAVATNQPQLLTYIWQQAAGTASLYLNGTLVATKAAGTATVTLGDATVALGWFNDPAALYGYLTSYLSEVLIFNYSLPTSSRTSLEHYIRASYGILGTPAAKAGTLKVPSFM